ncbi:MAG: ribonuclease E/G [Paracoccaceae bacterium]|nr:ribonuclease E/G [Paracoccaceae bacterium]
MKGTLVALDQIKGRAAAALVIDGQVQDFLIDPPEDGPALPGTIYRATVDRLIKGQGGVFLKTPDGNAYLRGAKGRAPGETMLVQVTGVTEPGKGIPVTDRLLFKSKFAIVTPDRPGLNISRSIQDEDIRLALRAAVEPLCEDDRMGVIIRSIAAEADPLEVAEDTAEMLDLAHAMEAERTGAPQLLFNGPDAHHMAWREWGMPDDVETEMGCFEHTGVLEQMEAIFADGMALAGGGTLFVEPTRALVAVDVNTGADGSPMAGLKTNIAAARALPRALRLRGLGGQIVVDFAPMAKKDRKQLEQVLTAAFKKDTTETNLVGWTTMGNFELQRKRERAPLFAHDLA